MTKEQIDAGLQWWREQPDDRRLSLSSPNPMDGATDLTDEEIGDPIGHVRVAIIQWATRWLGLTSEQKNSEINADSVQAFVDGELERVCIRWADEESEPGSRWRP